MLCIDTVLKLFSQAHPFIGRGCPSPASAPAWSLDELETLCDAVSQFITPALLSFWIWFWYDIILVLCK